MLHWHGSDEWDPLKAGTKSIVVKILLKTVSR